MGASDVPSFLGYGSPSGDYTLDFPNQAKAWIRSLAGDTGCNLLVTFVDADSQKTRRQEKGFHAMISPWATKRGEGVDTLKQVLLGEVFGFFTFVHPKTGEEFKLLAEPSTSRLTKRQYSLLIERSLDIAAEWDNEVLTPPDEWREMKAKERRAARRAAK